MKLLYCFKKNNGEYTIVDETLAYSMLYEKQMGVVPQEYMGAFKEEDYLNLLGERIFKSREYRESLITPELRKKMQINAVTGAMSPEEWDFTAKINKFDKELEISDIEKLLETAEKVYPDKNLNVVTPKGHRDEILAHLQR